MTDDEIVCAIREAHALGLKVVPQARRQLRRRHVARPHRLLRLGCAGRAELDGVVRVVPRSSSCTPPRIAEAEGCEMLCIGCEMVRADGQEAHWRRLIADVRAVYSGPDHLQLRQVPGRPCHLVGRRRCHLVERLLPDRLVGGAARPHRARGRSHPASRSSSWRPAARSRTGSRELPNDWALPGAPSGEEQLRYYRGHGRRVPRAAVGAAGSCCGTGRQRCMRAAMRPTNDDYCPYGKPAGAYLREQYAALARGGVAMTDRRRSRSMRVRPA